MVSWVYPHEACRAANLHQISHKTQNSKFIILLDYFSADPLDNKYVELRDSEDFPLAGEGLIAKKDIAPDTTFCLMNGNNYL